MAAVPATIAVAVFVPLALARVAGANVVLDPPALATLGASLGLLTLPVLFAVIARSRSGSGAGGSDAPGRPGGGWTSWGAALVLVPGVVAAIAYLAPGRLQTSVTKELSVGLALEPQLAPEERAMRGERLARELIRALPVAPREWSWVQRAPVEMGSDGASPVGWLRLSFRSSDAGRAAERAARRWLATTTGVRGWIATGAARALAGDESRPELEVWCSAATAKERRALAVRVKARLASALPSGLVVDGATAQVEWRVAPRASRIVAGSLDVDEAVEAALGGFDVGSLQIAGVEPGIRLFALPDDELALVPVRGGAGGAAGRVVPLGTAATIRRVSGTEPIERHDGSPAVRLIVRGGTAADVSTLRRALAAVALDPGGRLDVAGPAAEE
jgi:hypothetical protein